MSQIIAAGFLLVKPVSRPAWVSSTLMPEYLVSASACICPRFPGSYAISWCGDPPAERATAFDNIGLEPEKREAATKWATDAFETAYGWPAVFFTLDSARDARARFFPNGELVVLGLGLPAQYHETFVREATPPPQQPGFAPEGKSGCLIAVEMNRPLPPGGTVLGYEPMNMMRGQLDHSWLCNHLEQYAADHLDIRAGSSGFIESLSEASRCCDGIEGAGVGAEPGRWLPWLLARYPAL